MENQLMLVPNSLDLEDYISLAQKYNLSFEINDFFQPSILDDAKKTEELIEKYLGAGIPEGSTLHGVFYDITIFSADEEINKIGDKRIHQSVDIAKKLGINSIIFHTNIIPSFKLESYCENWIHKNEEYWRKLMEENPNINIYMENMFDFDPTMLCSLAKRLSDCPNFGICFDFAHAAIGPTPVLQWIKELAPYVRHIHINDNDGKSDLHLGLGEGNLNIKELFRLIEEENIKASILLEVTGIDKAITSIEYIKKL